MFLSGRQDFNEALVAHARPIIAGCVCFSFGLLALSGCIIGGPAFKLYEPLSVIGTLGAFFAIVMSSTLAVFAYRGSRVPQPRRFRRRFDGMRRPKDVLRRL